MAGSSPEIVYKGFWIDYDGSPVGKYQLTLDSRPALVFVTILTILVTYAANRSWKIWRYVAFAICRRVLRRRTRSSFVRHQQVILRNSETAGGAFLSLAEIAIERKVKEAAPRKISASLPLLVFALLHWASFVALGILTSEIRTGSTVRSMETEHCGLWIQKQDITGDLSHDATRNALATSTELEKNATLEADDYVRNCYNIQSEGVLDCNRLIKRSINVVSEQDECVFTEDICKAANGTALALDSGNVSFSDLGLNFPLSRSLSFRRRSICSPIPLEPFYYSPEQTLAYAPGEVVNREEVGMYAHIQSAPNENMTVLYRSNFSSTYELYAVIALDGTLPLAPIRPQRIGMQVTVITLRGGQVTSNKPSWDPFFYFQAMFTVPGDTGSNYTLYIMSRPINSVACQEMVQYCSDETGRCSDWTGVYEKQSAAELLGPYRIDDQARLVLNAVQHAMQLTTLDQAIGGRGVDALQASRFLSNSFQLRLSDEQWKVELRYWFQVALARSQLGILRLVRTPGLDVDRVRSDFDIADLDSSICSLVKFRSADHTSLSTIGVVLVLVVTLLLTLLSYTDHLAPRVLPSGPLQAWTKDDCRELLKVVEPSDDQGLVESDEMPDNGLEADKKQTSVTHLPVSSDVGLEDGG
ncbi:MAG: hypothetical protein M1825_005763 [Sarcosagium campestre]|nr:MAG: hypothetical protein M1825_005763 [Sarcosagium campestre]